MATAPLCLVRKIEIFAFTFLIADVLILLTAGTIVVFAILHLRDNDWQWATDTELFNNKTWLTVIGSAIFSYEGIGVVLPIIEVTEKPEKFPNILLAVLMTNMILYTGFGQFCYFVWGRQLEGKPLVTEMLPPGPISYVLKCLYSINIVISVALQVYPANDIIEGYAYKKTPEKRKMWIINIQRTVVVALGILACILLGKSLDKFNSLTGTLTATPVAFTIPCLMHLALCNPTRAQKIADIGVIVLSIVILFFCSGFTLWTWNE